jgi:hypothetical protein
MTSNPRVVGSDGKRSPSSRARPSMGSSGLEGGDLNRVAQAEALAEVVVDPPGQGCRRDQQSPWAVDTMEGAAGEHHGSGCGESRCCHAATPQVLTAHQHRDREGERCFQIEQQRTGGCRQTSQTQHQRHRAHHAPEHGEPGQSRPITGLHRRFRLGAAQHQPQQQQGHGRPGIEQGRDADCRALACEGADQGGAATEQHRCGESGELTAAL